MLNVRKHNSDQIFFNVEVSRFQAFPMTGGSAAGRCLWSCVKPWRISVWLYCVHLELSKYHNAMYETLSSSFVSVCVQIVVRGAVLRHSWASQSLRRVPSQVQGGGLERTAIGQHVKFFHWLWGSKQPAGQQSCSALHCSGCNNVLKQGGFCLDHYYRAAQSSAGGFSPGR